MHAAFDYCMWKSEYEGLVLAYVQEKGAPCQEALPHWTTV